MNGSASALMVLGEFLFQVDSLFGAPTIRPGDGVGERLSGGIEDHQTVHGGGEGERATHFDPVDEVLQQTLHFLEIVLHPPGLRAKEWALLDILPGQSGMIVVGEIKATRFNCTGPDIYPNDFDHHTPRAGLTVSRQKPDL